MAPPKDQKSSHGAGSSSKNQRQKKNGASKTSQQMNSHPASHSGVPSPNYERGSSSSQSQGDLPRSVRNAPPELRPLIRRRQNNESAKRSRERKKEEQEEMHKMFEENSLRIDRLEKTVDKLEAEVEERKKGKNPRDNSRRKDRRDDPDSSSSKSGFYGDPF